MRTKAILVVLSLVLTACADTGRRWHVECRDVNNETIFDGVVWDWVNDIHMSSGVWVFHLAANNDQVRVSAHSCTITQLTNVIS